MIRTSIIIPLHGGLELTKACHAALETTLAHRDDVEIVYVDNASVDDTRAWLETLSGAATLVLLDENQNFSGGCNRGVEASRGANVVLLNNDTEPRAGWLEVLEERLEEPTVGIVGCLLLYPDSTVQHCGVCFSGVRYPEHIHAGAANSDPRVHRARDVQAVTAACLGVRRAVWDELDGLDEAYRNGLEDVDLCIRASERGYRVAYDPRAVVLHHEGQSDGRVAAGSENLERFERQHYDRHIPDKHLWDLLDGVSDIDVMASRAEIGDGIDNETLVASLCEGRLDLRAGGVTLSADALLVERVGGIDPTLDPGDALLEWLDRCRLAGAVVRATGAFPPARPWMSSDVDALLLRWGACNWQQRELVVPLPFIDAEQQDEALVQVERQAQAVLLVAPADELEAAASDAFEQLRGTADDLTLLIRIEPGDDAAYAALEAAAEDIADDDLPDIAIVEGASDIDVALARTCEAVLTAGSQRQRLVQRSIARAAGVAQSA